MSDNCVYPDMDSEEPACYSEVLRRARKDHRCCECGDPIRAGDLYELRQLECEGRDFFPAGWVFTRMVEDFRQGPRRRLSRGHSGHHHTVQMNKERARKHYRRYREVAP